MKLIAFLFLTGLASLVYSKKLPVGSGKTYANPALAAAIAQPGDTILIYPGIYQGAFFITNLNGRSNLKIVIMGTKKEDVIFKAGSEGLHLSDNNHVKIQDLTFTGQTGNGMNIDDDGSIQTPSKHIIVTRCDFKNMGAQGNNDFLKLSGLDSFEISECNFKNAAAGGSGIDMVGCHYGRILRCQFDSMGSNCIQMKGGTQFIHIQNNHFINGGQRALNLGGSTGLAFFRPIDAKFEAADIQVLSNVFKGSMAPIAYVGCERVDVANNTIYFPEKWVIRILQETVDVNRFVPCGNNSFRNNIIYYNSAVSTHVNIGSNTASSTFLFSNNLWFNSSNPSTSKPTLPSTESSPIYGQDPLFVSNTNFSLQKGSPAIGKGLVISNLPVDMNGLSYKNPPSIGAYEYYGISSTQSQFIIPSCEIYPNPTTGLLNLEFGAPAQVQIYTSTGTLIQKFTDAEFQQVVFPAKGFYYLHIQMDGHLLYRKISVR